MRLPALKAARRMPAGEAGGVSLKPTRAWPSEGPGFGEFAGIPIYGNWCGPGHGGGEPIDAVDEVCRRHDQCYDERGYFDCSCDRDLIARMPDAIINPGTPTLGKVAGAAAAAVFAITPCVCRRWCFPFVGCSPFPVPIPGLPGLKRCPPPFA